MNHRTTSTPMLSKDNLKSRMTRPVSHQLLGLEDRLQEVDGTCRIGRLISLLNNLVHLRKKIKLYCTYIQFTSIRLRFL